MRVRDVMTTDVISIPADTSIINAKRIMRERKIRRLPVVDDDKLVDIVTTNDFFYKIVNPLLGLGEPGSRIEIIGGGESKELEGIISTVNSLGMEITGLHIENLPEMTKKDICVHINSEDVSQLITDLQGQGYKASLVRR